MFIWDFSAIFAVILILGVGLVLTLWMVYNLSRGQEGADDGVTDYFRHCRYCGYVYLDYHQSNPFRCPRCQSYHD